MDSNN